MIIHLEFLNGKPSSGTGLVVDQKPWLARVLLPIITGAFIYIFFRSETIILVDFMHSLSVWEIYVTPYQKNIAELASVLPGWFIYSLPDGLWAYALFATGLLLWPDDTDRRAMWFIISLSATLGSELLQRINVLPGSFCLYDMFFYSIAIALYFFTDKVTVFKVRRVLFKKVLVPLIAGIFCFTSFATGEVETIVTVGQIASCAASLLKLMNEVGDATQKTTATVGASYTILKEDVVKYPTFTLSDSLAKRAVEKMEMRLATMKSRAIVLHNAMSSTISTSEQYYSLLTTRANQNKTESFKQSSLQSINDSKARFNLKLSEANAAIANLDRSIQRYDDILNVIQIQTGLSTVQAQLGEVDSIIAQTESLNAEVQRAIDEGTRIITNDSSLVPE